MSEPSVVPPNHSGRKERAALGMTNRGRKEDRERRTAKSGCATKKGQVGLKSGPTQP